jgi:hypothetical protein
LNFAEIVFAQNTSHVSLKELKWRRFLPSIEPHHQERESRPIAHGWLGSSMGHDGLKNHSYIIEINV